MEVAILGELIIKDDEERVIDLTPHPMTRALLSLLALRPWALSAAEIKPLLWETDEHDLTSRLTSLNYRARLLLPPDRLVTITGDGPRRYQLDRRRGERWDVDHFRDAIALAARARDAGDLRTATQRYGEALAVWRLPDSGGSLLPEFTGTDAIKMHPEICQLLDQWRAASEAYAELKLDLGDHGPDLSNAIQGLIRAQPAHTRLYRLKMLSDYRSGRKAEALEAHRAATSLFHREFSARPDRHLDELATQIASDEPGLQWLPPAVSLSRLTGTRRPTLRGFYDAALGGKDNFESDRELLTTLVSQVGDAYPRALRASRNCVKRMVDDALAAGVDQFIDLGCGLPHQTQVHELATKAEREARVLHVDNDPLVAAYADALLTSRNLAFCRADLREEVDIVLYEARKHLDLTRPVAVLAVNVLDEVGRLDDDLGTAELAQALNQLLRGLTEGSTFGLIHLTRDGMAPDLRAHLDATNPDAPLPHYLRNRTQIKQLFGELTLTSSGLAEVSTWCSSCLPVERDVQIVAGLGVLGAPCPQSTSRRRKTPRVASCRPLRPRPAELRGKIW